MGSGWAGAAGGYLTPAAADAAYASVFGGVGAGIDPTGNTDCTAGVQAIINAALAAGGGRVWMPPGLYLFTGSLVPKNGVIIEGASSSGTKFRALTPAVPLLAPAGSAGCGFEKIALQSTTGGAVMSGALSQSWFRDCELFQAQAGVPIFDMTQWINNKTDNCEFDHVIGATVPSFRAISPTGDIGGSSFNDSRLNSATFWVEGSFGAYAKDMKWNNTTFEVVNGLTVFTLLSNSNAKIDGYSVNDPTGTYTNDIALLGASATSGGKRTVGTVIIQPQRDQSVFGLTGGKYDINVSAADDTTIINPRANPAAPSFLINMGGAPGRVIGGDATISNSWIALPLANSWANAGGGTTPAGYQLTADGLHVELCGSITGGTTTTVATLPAGYIPPTAKFFTLQNLAAGGAEGCEVNAAGVITVGVSGVSAETCLDGIRFPLDR